MEARIFLIAMLALLACGPASASIPTPAPTHTPTPTPEPELTPAEAAQLFEEVLSGGGEASDAEALFRVGYLQLLGSLPEDDGIEIRSFDRAGFVAYQIAKFGDSLDPDEVPAFCCTSSAGTVYLVVRHDVGAQSLLVSLAHESGHALHGLRLHGPSLGGPDQPYDHGDGPALQEAQAHVFAAAILRALGEYAGVDVVSLREAEVPDSAFYGHVDIAIASRDHPHTKGFALVWAAVLSDSALADLRSEFDSNGALSARSLLRLFDHLVGKTDVFADYVAQTLPMYDRSKVTGVLAGRIGTAQRAGLLNGFPYLLP